MLHEEKRHDIMHMLGSNSFRFRLFKSFMLIALPILLAIACIFSFFLHANNLEGIEQNQNAELDRLNTQIQHVIADTQSISQEIVYDESVQKYLMENMSDAVRPDGTVVNYYINGYATDRDYIERIVLTSTDRILLSTDRTQVTNNGFYGLEDKWWFLDFMSDKGLYHWYPYAGLSPEQYGEKEITQGREEDNVLMLARPIYSTKDFMTLYGYVMIYIDPDYIQEIWDSITWGNTTNVFVTDVDGRVLLRNNAEKDYSYFLGEVPAPPDSEMTDVMHGKMILSSRAVPDTRWHIYMMTPLREVNTSLKLLLAESLFIIIALTLVLFFLARFASRTMAQPVIQLSELMDSYHGDMSRKPDTSLTQIYENRTDEIGQMYRSYEQLVDRLNHLIHDIYVKNLEKRDAELALLQSQINPHFLYNTLDSINWLALANDQDEISEMITALSDTFRLSLMKNNSSFVEMDQEIQYIKSYLMLQKYRYAERLNYVFDLPEPLPKLYLPRFILQPVVENALKHGINKIESGGNIIIRIRIKEDVTLYIYNDGTDIDLKKMEQLLFFDPSQTDLLAFQQDGYGVQNIHRRIKVICGDAYGISYSVDRTQTCCKICLPVKTEL